MTSRTSLCSLRPRHGLVQQSCENQLAGHLCGSSSHTHEFCSMNRGMPQRPYTSANLAETSTLDQSHTSDSLINPAALCQRESKQSDVLKKEFRYRRSTMPWKTVQEVMEQRASGLGMSFGPPSNSAPASVECQRFCSSTTT